MTAIRVIAGAVATLAVLGAASQRDTPPPAPMSCVEDEIPMVAAEPAYGWQAGDRVCIHVDMIGDGR